MKNLSVPIFVAVLCVVFAVSSSPAGLNLSGLNPFSKKESKPQSPRFPQPKRNKSIVPKVNFNRQRPPGRPSTLDKISNGTKRFFSSAADILTPWDNNRRNDRPSVSGSRGVTSGAPQFRSSENQEEKPSFIARLLPSGKPKEEEYPDVNSYLSQPRLGFR